MDRLIRISLVAGIFLLAACDDIPATFSEPAEELARIQEAGELDCERLRPDYWFCQSKAGFVHLYTVKVSGVAEPMVARVMLEGDQDLNAEIAELYGFSADDLASLENLESSDGAVTEGGFTLLLDPTWKQPVIRGSTARDTAQGPANGAD